MGDDPPAQETDALRAIALTPGQRPHTTKPSKDVRPAPSGRPAEEAADARTIARPMSPGVERDIKMFNRLSVGKQAQCLAAGRLAGVALISALALYSKYQRMLEDRRAALQNMVQVVVGVLNYHDRLARRQSAVGQRGAGAAPSGNCATPTKSILYLRHAPAIRCNTRSKPELNGQDISRQIRDPDGKLPFIAMRDVGEQPGTALSNTNGRNQGHRARQCPAGLMPRLCPVRAGGAMGLYLDDSTPSSAAMP